MTILPLFSKSGAPISIFNRQIAATFPHFHLSTYSHDLIVQRITDDKFLFVDENELFIDFTLFLYPEFYLCLQFVKISVPHEQINQNRGH